MPTLPHAHARSARFGAIVTADEVRARNEANPCWWPRYEAVYGELLVTPAPGGVHQLIAGRI